MFELDSSSFADAIRKAKPLKHGKNFCLASIWVVYNEKLRTTEVEGVTQAYHLRKLVNANDSDKYAIAVCGSPNNNVLMIQTPALEHEETVDWKLDMIEINTQTG